jgi:hypothetical protein
VLPKDVIEAKSINSYKTGTGREVFGMGIRNEIDAEALYGLNAEKR